ncbi:hypothetical protein SCLCIDRAFT_221625 [Scleroderma citrinum Foug A]|uniref:Uncharacterized protein n=1 Tax=Scleroderma citrinum Foug A TaxID=1036808 RepID=A0A0C3EGQ4_9AGAM|nr:hypothetical protein SCLCIDRAFT_221625 [Scleroderma citrinum Foug A]
MRPSIIDPISLRVLLRAEDAQIVCILHSRCIYILVSGDKEQIINDCRLSILYEPERLFHEWPCTMKLDRLPQGKGDKAGMRLVKPRVTTQQ